MMGKGKGKGILKVWLVRNYDPLNKKQILYKTSPFC